MKEPRLNILSQYRYIVDETNIVSKSDLRGNITFVNNKFIEVSGYSLVELLGRPHSILRSPDTPSSLFKELWDTIQAKKIWNGVLENIRKDGSIYIVDASIYPMLNDKGEIIEYISIRHDITELRELNHKVEMLRKYDIEQQTIAQEKLQAVIVNELKDDECKVLYHPSDILSGDSYSIFKRNDGSTLMYILDGQGHGILPALTVFAISTTIKHLIHSHSNMEELCKNLFPTIKTFLGDIEQLSYIMIIISSNRQKLSYVSGGMYPFLLKIEDEIIKVKTNNLPFMEFSEVPTVDNLDISGWESLLLYSDGLIEHENRDEECFLPNKLIASPKLIDCTLDLLHECEFDDDMTLIHLKNCSNS